MEIGERTALIAILVNLVILGIKFVAASLSGSLALKAESFHTLADLIASLTAFIGLKIAKRKTKAFPYGLYKIENLFSVMIALVIFYTAYEIVREVILGKVTAITQPWSALFSVAAAIGLTFFFSRYENRIGRQIDSPILLADAAHIRTDIFSNLVVLAAILSSWTGWNLDRYAALIVALLILRTGLQILRDGAKVLLDASIEYGTLRKVEQIITETPQVVELKSLTGRNSGRFKFIEASIVIKTHSLDRACLISSQIETKARQTIGNIDRVLIHYEPLQKEDMCYVFPMAEDRLSISPHFGEAPFFLIVTFKTENIIAASQEWLDNPFLEIEKGKGIQVAELLVQKGADAVFVRKDFASKGPAYVFSSANVEVIVTESLTPQAMLADLGLYL